QGSGCRSGIPKNATLSQAQASTVTILSQRVNSLGVAESNVQAQGNDQVLVQLPGVDIQTATKVIGTTARLSFAEAVPNDNGATTPSAAELKRDQLGHYNAAQLSDPASYPTGYHWKINQELDATDVTSATVNPSGSNGQIAVDISFNDNGATQWGNMTGR